MRSYHNITTRLDRSCGIHVSYCASGTSRTVFLPFPPSKIHEGRAFERVIISAALAGHRPGKAFVCELRLALAQCELDWPSDCAAILEGSYNFKVA